MHIWKRLSDLVVLILPVWQCGMNHIVWVYSFYDEMDCYKRIHYLSKVWCR